jgi:hypothetical protein
LNETLQEWCLWDSLQNFPFLCDSSMNMSIMDNSCFWLVETLILISLHLIYNDFI